MTFDERTDSLLVRARGRVAALDNSDYNVLHDNLFEDCRYCVRAWPDFYHFSDRRDEQFPQIRPFS